MATYYQKIILALMISKTTAHIGDLHFLDVRTAVIRLKKHLLLIRTKFPASLIRIY